VSDPKTSFAAIFKSGMGLVDMVSRNFSLMCQYSSKTLTSPDQSHLHSSGLQCKHELMR